MVSIPGTSLAYRVVESGEIEKSEDSGNTWQTLTSIRPMSNLEAYYYQLTHIGNPALYRTPPDILYDPTSGNVIVARSLAGVYVITPDQQVLEIGVGESQPAHLYTIDAFVTLFATTFLTALILLLLFANGWFFVSRRWINRAIWIILCIGWLILLSLAMSLGYAQTVFFMGFALLAILTLALLIGNVVVAMRNSHVRWWLCLPFALIGSLLFLLPYLLWYAGILSAYTPTVIISLVLTVGWGICGGFYTHKHGPPPPPRKPKPKKNVADPPATLPDH